MHVEQNRSMAWEPQQPLRTSLAQRAAHPTAAPRAATGVHDHAPHPLTPERLSIQRQNALIGALHDAMDARDPEQLRTLVEEYRELDPDDVQQLQQGFELIADCMEYGDDDARREAASYHDQARASTVRRFVRRFCLESGDG